MPGIPWAGGYRLTDAYDIRQTQGRDLKKVQLKDDSKEMSIALRAILNYSVVPVATDHDLPVAAYYDSKKYGAGRQSRFLRQRGVCGHRR